jgi:hypothetical protein
MSTAHDGRVQDLGDPSDDRVLACWVRAPRITVWPDIHSRCRSTLWTLISRLELSTPVLLIIRTAECALDVYKCGMDP